MADEPSRDDTQPRASAETPSPTAAQTTAPVPVTPPGPTDPTTPGSPSPVAAPRRGGGLRQVFTGAVVGAVVGALVAGGLVSALDDSGTSTVTRIVQQTPAPTPVRPSTSIAAANGIAGIVAKAEPSIVAITTDGGPGSGNGGAGTGFVISPDGYIATNNHVVEGATKIQVQFASGRIVDATTVGRDPSTDLAVIKANATGLPAATLGDSNPPNVQIGDSVVAIGNALALEGGLSVTNGIISGLNRQVPEQSGAVLFGMLQTDAAINPGNSGGPLLDSQARVIGINTAVAGAVSSSSQAQNIGFAIPISNAIPVFNDLRTGRKPAFLGVSTTDLSPSIASQLNVSVTDGAVITQVSTNTPASSAGLKKNDVIVQIGQTPIKGSADVQTAVRSHQPGDTVQIVIVRGTSRQTLSAKLTQRPNLG
ncbi:MAG TPA: trypsin-like peptidase domain-containing protein [Acidimicrobiia bacterium]|nr:trypsin-like peptidase domain-containing protein [Acidimicrobiia bacterium]